MKFRPLPNLEYIRECLDYEPRRGRLWWKKRPLKHFKDRASWLKWNTRYAGKRAFVTKSDGYHKGAIDGVQYPTHRIIWKLEHGEDPPQIDHKNRQRTHNKITNLRPATTSQNVFNQTNRNGTRRGVQWRPDKKRWYAHLGVGRKQLFLGSFTSFVAARTARKAAEREHFGEYAT